MKNLYLKHKGKVYPSPSSSSPTATDSALSLLRLLPAAILALASVLSVEDREVLAYLITTNPSCVIEDKRKKCRKPAHSQAPHRAPLFDCGCFECYTSYWFRWDSSPNRELIHQVIEAFEDHLSGGERGRGGGRGKKKVFDKTPEKKMVSNSAEMKTQSEVVVAEVVEEEMVVAGEVGDAAEEEEAAAADEVVVESVAMGVSGGCYNHKGLARKVLPDVMGLFNSRIWNLWSNNI